MGISCSKKSLKVEKTVAPSAPNAQQLILNKRYMDIYNGFINDTNEFIPINVSIDSYFYNKQTNEDYIWLYSLYSIRHLNKSELIFIDKILAANLEHCYQIQQPIYIDKIDKMDNYKYDLVNMKRIQDGYLEHIIRITKEEMLKIKEDYINYLNKNVWQYAYINKDNTKYVLYPPYIQRLLFELNKTDDEIKKLNILYLTSLYEINLVANIITNLKTGKTQKIIMINIRENNHNIKGSFDYKMKKKIG
jgi:hypothetical protein